MWNALIKAFSSPETEACNNTLGIAGAEDPFRPLISPVLPETHVDVDLVGISGLPVEGCNNV